MSENLGTSQSQSNRRGLEVQTLLPAKIPVALGPPNATQPQKPWVKHSRGFVVTVVFILLTEYLLYNGVILLPSVFHDCLSYKNCRMWTAIDAAIFHWFFILVVISYIKCIRTDPGRIPKHWAFYRGDRAKRRRYCKECNAWKPDRAHHCSACCRCVLNMDHHCPWINNCVGFQNRKYFMLLLVYGVFGLSFVTLQCTGSILQDLWKSLVLETYPIDPALLVATGFFGFGSGFLLLALVQFLSFHIRLVSANLTTIENLDTSSHGSSAYDVGLIKNWQQVFGSNPLLWWIPYSGLGGGPAGDGVRWPLARTSGPSFQ